MINEISSWYIALAYVKNQELDSARVYLNQVVNQNSVYSIKAVEILDKISEEQVPNH